MLEPLIVLTVLNCFFMFSSTVTTCALWWQYRSHRCCFKKDPTNHGFSKLKSTCAKTSKKSEKTKLENGSENGNGNNREKSSSLVVHRDNKSRRNSKQKSRSSSNWFRNKSLSSDPAVSLETMESWEIENNARMSEDNARMLEDTARMSEASQTANEAKAAVVMEYSTVQKIVQILDDATDLDATKLAIRDFNAKHNPERKAIHNFSIEPKSEPRIPIYTTLPQT